MRLSLGMFLPYLIPCYIGATMETSTNAFLAGVDGGKQLKNN